MGHRTRGRIFIPLLIVPLLIVSLLAGCSSSGTAGDSGGDSDSGYMIYCVNVKTGVLEKVSYQPKAKTDEELLSELMDAIRTYPTKSDYGSAIPDSVGIKDYELSDGTLSVNFDSGYLKMESTREALCRAAVVLTMTRITSVTQVVFQIEGAPLTDARGDEIGPMTAESFVDSSSSAVNNYRSADLTLYYGNTAGNALVRTTRSVRYSSNTSVAKVILSQLMKDPGTGARSVIPKGTKILGVTIRDSVCYVNFDSAFTDEQNGVADQVQIYSVVNSLIDGAKVTQVQIAIDGNSDMKFHENISLDKAFEKNTDLIESDVPDASAGTGTTEGN